MKNRLFQIWIMISVMLILSLACSLGSMELFGSSEQTRETGLAAETILPEAVLQDETPPADPFPANTPTQKSVLDEIIEELLVTTKVNPVDGAMMVYVPEGEFLMGSEDEDAVYHEKLQHLVYLDAFWIYQHEVTNDEYRLCVISGACSQPVSIKEFNNLENNNNPVRYVNWFQAKDYCTWARGRLPTEAEWEKAARGTDGRKYPWGDESPNCILTLYGGCPHSEPKPKPVGSHPLGASPYGALDMAGNVWEWVADWYSEDYYNYSPNKNPTGPPSGEFRVIRGGSWFDVRVSDLRVSGRQGIYQNYRGSVFGFRCLRSPEP